VKNNVTSLTSWNIVQWASILKAPKHSWEKNRNLQTGSPNATIFAVFGWRFGQLALPVYNFLRFSQQCLGAFKIQVSCLLDKHAVSHWSCKFLKLCQKNLLFVQDLLRFLTHCFTLIRQFMYHQCHFLGSYNDQDHQWAAKISKLTISASYKTRKPSFLVELENDHYV
jgi:hypothetical protein